MGKLRYNYFSENKEEIKEVKVYRTYKEIIAFIGLLLGTALDTYIAIKTTGKCSSNDIGNLLGASDTNCFKYYFFSLWFTIIGAMIGFKIKRKVKGG